VFSHLQRDNDFTVAELMEQLQMLKFSFKNNNPLDFTAGTKELEEIEFLEARADNVLIDPSNGLPFNFRRYFVPPRSWARGNRKLFF
jgi:hypothetical protein